MKKNLITRKSISKTIECKGSKNKYTPISNTKRTIASILLFSHLLSSCRLNNTILPDITARQEIQATSNTYAGTHQRETSTNNFPITVKDTTCDNLEMIFDYKEEAGLIVFYKDAENKTNFTPIEEYPVLQDINGRETSLNKIKKEVALLLAQEGKWAVSKTGALKYLGMRGKGGMQKIDQSSKNQSAASSDNPLAPSAISLELASSSPLKEFDNHITNLVDLVNDDLKWNFVVRDKIKEAMQSIGEEKFSNWIQGSSEYLKDLEDIGLPEKIARKLISIKETAKQILIPEYSASDADFYHVVEFESECSTLVKKLKEQSVKIKSPETEDDVVQEILDNMHRTTGHRLDINDEDDKTKLLNCFSTIFSTKVNQSLDDSLIDEKIKDVFSIIEHDPKISVGNLGRSLQKIWAFSKGNEQQTITDLAEIFVNHNPYKVSLEKVLYDAISRNNAEKLIDKALIYRLPGSPFSLKIHSVKIIQMAGDEYKIELRSDVADLTASLTVKEKKDQAEITTLAFTRLKEIPLNKCMDDVFQEKYKKTIKKSSIPDQDESCVPDQQKKTSDKSRFSTATISMYTRDDIAVQIEPKLNSPQFQNPFKTGVKYRMKIIKAIYPLYAVARTNYTDYKFISIQDPGDSINIRVNDGSEKFTFEVKHKRMKPKVVEQNMPWETYKSLFSVLTCDKASHFLSARGENKLDPRLLSLSEEPIPTEDAVKKALREKDNCKFDLLNQLMQDWDNKDETMLKAFEFINNDPAAALSEDLFEALFANNIFFTRLCNNQYVKADYDTAEGKAMPLPLKQRFALDVLHEVQVYQCAHAKPENQKGNLDLTTGSGKSTTVSYIMGIPMERFEDEYGVERVRNQQSDAIDFPKIGFQLGISETTHASSFALLEKPVTKQTNSSRFSKTPSDTVVLCAISTGNSAAAGKESTTGSFTKEQCIRYVYNGIHAGINKFTATYPNSRLRIILNNWYPS